MTTSQITPKQRVFLNHYAQSLNLTQSVQAAYPGMKYTTARSYGVYLKKKNPLVGKAIKQIHEKIYNQVSEAEVIFALKKMYEDNADRTITLTRKTSTGLIVKREVDCNRLALQALGKLADIITIVKTAH